MKETIFFTAFGIIIYYLRNFHIKPSEDSKKETKKVDEKREFYHHIILQIQQD